MTWQGKRHIHGDDVFVSRRAMVFVHASQVICVGVLVMAMFVLGGWPTLGLAVPFCAFAALCIWNDYR